MTLERFRIRKSESGLLKAKCEEASKMLSGLIQPLRRRNP